MTVGVPQRPGAALLAGLSTRGRAFLAVGVACALSAVLLGQRDLMRVSVLVVAVPLLCLLLVARAQHRLELDRTITPARVPVGQPATVRLQLTNLAWAPTGVLLAEDLVPSSLGSRPRFVLDRLAAGQSAAVTYALRGQLRGRYQVGPLQLRLTDPFGMVQVSRSFTATDALVVIPQTWALTTGSGGGEWAGAGESHSRSAAASGEDDVTMREYRHGDDLRRVHWRSTARRGELMVRRDQQPQQMRATVVVDRRTVGHRGDGPDSSLEWAVSAAASVCLHLVAQGYGVRLVHDGTAGRWSSADRGEGGGQLLEELAMMEGGGPRVLSEAVHFLSRGGGDALVVAVLGEVDQQDVAPLASLVRRGARGVALLLDTPGWTPLPPRRRSQIEASRRRSELMLRGVGWAVVAAEASESVAQAWARAQGSTSPQDTRAAVASSGGSIR